MRGPQEAATFTVINVVGREVPVTVPDARQLEGLKQALEGQPPLPANITALRVEKSWYDPDLSVLHQPDADHSDPWWSKGAQRYEYSYRFGRFGGLWDPTSGEVVIQDPSFVDLHAKYGKDYNLTAAYAHTWAHEIGHARYDWGFTPAVGASYSTTASIKDSFMRARLDFISRYRATHGVPPLRESRVWPHRLDDVSEWFAESYATFVTPKHPLSRSGVSFYRPDPRLVPFFERVGTVRRTGRWGNPEKPGPWERDYP